MKLIHSEPNAKVYWDSQWQEYLVNHSGVKPSKLRAHVGTAFTDDKQEAITMCKMYSAANS